MVGTVTTYENPPKVSLWSFPNLVMGMFLLVIGWQTTELFTTKSALAAVQATQEEHAKLKDLVEDMVIQLPLLSQQVQSILETTNATRNAIVLIKANQKDTTIRQYCLNTYPITDMSESTNTLRANCLNELLGEN